ncbi:MAG: type II toxin-antitoxin system RelE/ParE family toxin [Verrucomicrobia bacterium]|nr:MAG: type II toxin-antitoxin system RelE/ParE family toxin [Verrucomicrobiota bacterium]
MTYAISILRSAQASLTTLAPTSQTRVITAIRKLAINPRPAGVKKLAGREAWRIRVGDYRIIYEINDAELTILVVDLGHRREIYR